MRLHARGWCPTNPTLQMGVFLDDVVRVGLVQGEAAIPMVNLGKQTDVQPRLCGYTNVHISKRNMCNTQIYSAIRLVTLLNVFADLVRSQLIGPMGCQVFTSLYRSRLHIR
jgi:hypothetical protein